MRINRSRIFVFGVGLRPDLNLRLAGQNGSGQRRDPYDYIEPREDIEIAVSSLVEKNE